MDVRTLAPLLAFLLVATVPVAAVGALSAGLRWVRWILRVGGAIGTIGLALTGAAVVNLFIPRTCDHAGPSSTTRDERNRPVISLVLGDGQCFRSAVMQLQLAGLAGVATSVVAARPFRRSRPAADGASPAARLP